MVLGDDMPADVFKIRGERVQSDDHNSVAITAMVPNTDLTVIQFSSFAPNNGRFPFLTLGSESSPMMICLQTFQEEKESKSDDHNSVAITAMVSQH